MKITQKTLLTISLIAVMSTSNANIKTDISNSINNHLKVVQKQQKIESNSINLLEIRSQDSIKVNFRTASNANLFSNVSVISPNYSDGFIDGIVEMNGNIYDFGMSEYAYRSERENKEVSKLEREGEYETILHKLLSVSSKVSFLEEKLVHLEKINKFLDVSIDDLKLRFKSGVGTITSIREIQLEKLDLENSIISLKSQKQTLERLVKKEFGIGTNKITSISDHAKLISNTTVANNNSLSCLLGREGQYSQLSFERTNQILSHSKLSSKYDIDRIQAADKPHLSGNIIGTIHDMDQGFGEYSVTAGINVSFSLYDGGEADIKEKKAIHRLNVRESEIESMMMERGNKFDEILFSCDSLISKKAVLSSKKVNLKKKIDDAKFRATVIDTDPVHRIKAEFSLSKINAELMDIDNELITLNLNYLQLSESLVQYSLLNK